MGASERPGPGHVPGRPAPPVRDAGVVGRRGRRAARRGVPGPPLRSRAPAGDRGDRRRDGRVRRGGARHSPRRPTPRRWSGSRTRGRTRSSGMSSRISDDTGCGTAAPAGLQPRRCAAALSQRPLARRRALAAGALAGVTAGCAAASPAPGGLGGCWPGAHRGRGAALAGRLDCAPPTPQAARRPRSAGWPWPRARRPGHGRRRRPAGRRRGPDLAVPARSRARRAAPRPRPARPRESARLARLQHRWPDLLARIGHQRRPVRRPGGHPGRLPGPPAAAGLGPGHLLGAGPGDRETGGGRPAAARLAAVRARRPGPQGDPACGRAGRAGRDDPVPGAARRGRSASRADPARAV